MAKKLALVAVVIMVAVSAWWLARASEPVEAPPALATAEPAPTSATAVARELTPASSAANRAPIDSASSAAEASDDPYGALTVVLAWWDGTPAAGLELCLYPWAERQPVQAFQQRITDAQGRARVARIRAGTILVELERLGRDGGFQFEVERGKEHEERVTLARNCDVIGRVLDRSGAPVAGAQLWVKEDLDQRGYAVELSQADGSFRIRSVPKGFGVLATASDRGSSDTAKWEELESVDPFTRRVELRLRGESAELEGVVTDSAGQTVAGARISVRCINTTLEPTLRWWPFVRIASDEHGAFRVGGLHRGSAEVLVAAGFALKRQILALEEGRTARLSLALDTGFAVHGTVATRDGAPAAQVTIRAEQQDFGPDLYDLFTATDDEGSYDLELLPAGPIVLVASKHDEGKSALRAQTKLTGRAGDALGWNVVFGSGPSIRGRAIDEAGRALAGWSALAMPGNGSAAALSTSVVTDERGEFVIPDLADASYTVVLYAPEDPSKYRAVAERAFPDGAELEIVVPGERTPSAFLVGRVLDPEGKPIRPQISAHCKDDLGWVRNTWSEDERFRMGPMLAGEYELSIHLDGFPGFQRELALQEGEQLDLGDIALPRTGDARLTLHAADGGPIGQPATMLLMEGRYAHVLTSADGLVFESGPLWPGTYLLRAMSGSAAPAPPVSIVIRSGETSVTEVELVAARTVVLDFRVPEGEHFPRQIRVELRDESGALAFEQDSCKPQNVADHEVLMAFATLPLGHFACSARSDGGWAAAEPLEVVPVKDPRLHVTVPLHR